ncbi:PqqD family protein [Anaerocolumna xylanovorans]|uniref:Coenzyme PQQ synthesis protein D (PqqD) n=1 Tax=Anaerocolumna xylanovorans DSM 12503 TaxID=1121345 RepID=A0A1M7YAG4_9FIRM|nr:PqqD family protein [Anaerocolumna xylanovorans]SHO49566.1 Coenzyme PQQ synthesis protein D (PqqD) [Anaerocolumna xylanovorans DSM 12503]
MKIKEGFLLREIAGSFVVVPIGQRVIDFNGLMSLNESGALLWSRLEKGVESINELVGLLCGNYLVEEEKAREDIEAFINKITERGLMEDGNELGAIKCTADNELV